MCKQSKLESLIETSINIGSGMIIAYCIMQFFLAPILDIDISYKENLVVTIVLTFTSVLRSYLWRRFFANGFHEVVHKYIRRIYE